MEDNFESRNRRYDLKTSYSLSWCNFIIDVFMDWYIIDSQTLICDVKSLLLLIMVEKWCEKWIYLFSKQHVSHILYPYIIRSESTWYKNIFSVTRLYIFGKMHTSSYCSIFMYRQIDVYWSKTIYTRHGE